MGMLLQLYKKGHTLDPVLTAEKRKVITVVFVKSYLSSHQLLSKPLSHKMSVL